MTNPRSGHPGGPVGIRGFAQEMGFSMEHDSVPSSPLLNAALRYVRRGWAVTPLHHLYVDQTCSCGQGAYPEHKSTGKHPIWGEWPTIPVTDEATVLTVFGTRFPYANVGILTGPASGLWALDVDPKNGGDLALASLVESMGALPRTYTVRTGSGGTHYYWTMPGDFVPGGSPGRLPPGLDVRGLGGQVVAPPSVSGVGAYSVELDVPLSPAPEWLLDLIRPQARERSATPSPQVASGGTSGGPLDLDVGPPAADHGRGRRYALAAIGDELAKLRDELPGHRGGTAVRAAYAIIELINSPWAGLAGLERAVRTAYDQAAIVASQRGGEFDEREADECWRSAERKIGSRGRPEPAELDYGGGGEVLPWSEIPSPFDPTEAARIMSGGVSVGVSNRVQTVSPQVDDGMGGWWPEDIGPVLDGTRVAVKPEIGSRQDGVRLLYRGKEHVIAGEPESGKTWFALMIVRDVLINGGRVVYVDFEDDAATVVGRLLDLGVLPDRLRPEGGQFRYVRPEGRPRVGDVERLLAFDGDAADLMVHDGWTEGAGLLGLDVIKDQDDITKWRRAMVRPALTMGVATLTTDHVVKDRDTRGRYSIGAQHKLAGLTGAMFMVEVVKTWGRGRKGRSRVLVTKDRNSGLREVCVDDGPNVSHLGDLVGDAESGSMTSLILWPPLPREDGKESGDGPSELVDTIAEILATQGRPLGSREIRARAKGHAAHTDEALAWMEDNGWIEVNRAGPGRPKYHTWLGPPEPTVSTVSNRVLDALDTPPE